jgi:hypothetical protein
MSEYDPVKAVEMADARDKVIEAAKAFYEKEKHRRLLLPHDKALFDAVQALQALEGDG